MKRIFLSVISVTTILFSFAQVDHSQEVSPDASGIKAITGADFIQGKKNSTTKIKDQERTGTCWSFSTTSLVESQTIKNKLGAFDLSEMFAVRNIYVEKAKNYILRQGHAQFSQGGLGNDVIRSIATYGAMPETAYS